MSNHFDFNAWIKDGVPWLSGEAYDAKLEAIKAAGEEEPKPAKPASERVVVTSAGDKALLAKTVAELRAWLETPITEPPPVVLMPPAIDLLPQ